MLKHYIVMLGTAKKRFVKKWAVGILRIDDQTAVIVIDDRSEITESLAVRQLERDLPELLSVFAFPAHLRQKLRTTNVIERCFVEVRRRTQPMVCFVNVESVDRILYSIFHRFNLEWKTRTLSVFTQAA
jgi:putative transposase